jgi:hypothetical protein
MPSSELLATASASWSADLPTSVFANAPSEVSSGSDAYRQIVRNWLAGQNAGRSAEGLASDRRNERIDFPSTQPDLSSDTLAPSANVVVGMRKWVGEIVSIQDDLLTLELFPLGREAPVLVADFNLNLLAPDVPLARPGGIVYLTTRLVQEQSGYVEAMTNLRLRRPRRWAAEELSATMTRARARAKAIGKHAKRSAGE